MRMIAAGLIAALMALALAACGGGSGDSAGGTSAAANPPSTAAGEANPTESGAATTEGSAASATEGASSATDSAASTAGAAAAEQGAALNEYPETLRIYASLDERITKAGKKDYNDVAAYQELERRTGTKIVWTLPPAGADANQDLNLLITSGDLPDIIRFGWNAAPGGVDKYYQDGVILRLTELLGEHMPNIDRLLTERDIKKSLVYNADDIYFIPEIRKEGELNVFRGPVIRGDWLEQLGLPAPQTIDELRGALAAFRDSKPGGADTWGMSGISFLEGNFPIGKLLWPFGIHYDFYQVDGKVKYGPMEPEFADGMAYIHELYDDGLIDPDYSVQDRTTLDGKFMNHQVGFEYGMQPTMMNNSMADSDSGFAATGMGWPKLDAGSPGYVFDAEYSSWMLIQNSAAITTACKEPEKAAHWLNFIFGDEGALITNYGVEGESYTMEGGKPVFTEEFLNLGDEQYLYFIGSSSTFPTLRLWDTYSISLHERGADAIEKWTASADLSRLLPNIPLTAEEQQSVNDQLLDIKTYIGEQISWLVTGQAGAGDIPAIRAKLEDMGIQNCIDIYQAAYDRYLSK
ncbi:MAG: extracellular solute-binding protein [Clostridiales bacterium]|nr:extracellular solute-binding protein [Clostridiales bacterium]